jgi:hypothetical protein
MKRLGFDPTDTSIAAEAVDLADLKDIAWCMPVEWIHRPTPKAREVPENEVAAAKDDQRELEAVT